MIRKYLPIFVLGLVLLMIILINFAPSKFIIGWDNLLPEFNFFLNIKRAFFSVWEEYQGLGLLAGNGHAAELPRQIILFLFSMLIPTPYIRQGFMFGALITGTIGAYKLIWLLLLSYKPELAEDEKNRRILTTLGAGFYLLNLATIQTFYAPFEPFLVQFAMLPWLMYTTLVFLRHPNRRAFLSFLLVSVLAIPQGQVPTIFLVYFLILALLLFILNILVKQKKLLIQSSKVILLTIIINAFWLLPFIYFTLTNSSVSLAAKINQMSTETVILQNKEFGTIGQVMLLKGFWFNNVDPNDQAAYTYMMQPWREHLNNPFITLIGYAFFALICLGLYAGLKSKKPLLVVCGILFFILFTMLMTDTPPFSFINLILRTIIPLFGEVFRFTFTKFSVPLALFYAIFFAIGLDKLQEILSRYKKRIEPYYIVCALLLIIFSFPVFQGHLFYEKEKVVLPTQYSELFNYFNHQDPNTRIANLPQPAFWGWEFYRWGYGGSGFLWYGIKQPILDRAFDVWSSTDENYYWEMSQALYSRNTKTLSDVLNKYQINWIMLDKNIVSPNSSKTLFTPETQDLLSRIPAIHKTKTFGNIIVYSVSLKQKPNSFITVTPQLPSVNSFAWNNIDTAFARIGNYVSVTKNPTYTYPFRSLLSSKNQSDIVFHATETANTIQFSAPLPQANVPTVLTIPSYGQDENTIPAKLMLTIDQKNEQVITIQLETPTVTLGNQKLFGSSIIKPVFVIPETTAKHMILTANGVATYTLPPKPGVIGETFLSLRQDNTLVLTDEKNTTLGTTTIPVGYFDQLSQLQGQQIALPAFAQGQTLTVSYPKVTDTYLSFNPALTKANNITNCDNFRKGSIAGSSMSGTALVLAAKNATSCTALYTSGLPHDQGYAFFVDGRNSTGRGTHTWVENIDSGYTPIDTYLPSNHIQSRSNFIIPPLDPFGLSYSFHFESISIGNDKTQNTITALHVYPIPYTFLTHLVLTDSSTLPIKTATGNVIRVSHPNESLYAVTLTNTTKAQTLILSQAYNTGWVAVVLKDSRLTFVRKIFPFFFGHKIKNHILINNWENGWEIPTGMNTQQTIVLIFLPQYLQYGGFFIGFVGVLWAIWYYTGRRKV